MITELQERNSAPRDHILFGLFLVVESHTINPTPEEEMPSIIDQTTGKEFKPNLLISTKNLTRGLGGQIREMAAITSMFESIEAFRTKGMTKPRNPMILTFEDQKKVKPKLPNGPVLINGKRLSIRDTNGSIRELD
ncbi:hypothetical protein BKA67DRAFT_647360 [Truncatella angustata]|uniref:Uncharacterized protein n=1 Tax=Truncatella angustata TaxID=152316 RepID=A0A9P8UJS8_9PEZI|nr:uncharacterized protein BKA67DRAFT_647360 [Truncatella angustata]KAH6653502.1 hypothetical protein BKA67DRAFT_647360 [Truncatella angustata]